MENIYAVVFEIVNLCYGTTEDIVDFYYGLDNAIEAARKLLNEGCEEIKVTKVVTDDNGLVCESTNQDDIVFHLNVKEG